MSPSVVIGSQNARRWTRRVIPWIGGLLVVVIVAMAAYDVVRSYTETVNATGRELDAHARVIAEQTARTLQAVDGALRNIAEQSRRGVLEALNDRDLHAYLKEQAVGLVQSAGLAVLHPSGEWRATSAVFPLPEPLPTSADLTLFQVHRGSCCDIGLYIGEANPGQLDGTWVFPVTRRLESPAGKFAGIVGARGRVAYFQNVYRDMRLDAGTTIALIHQSGSLLARYPGVDVELGKPFPLLAQLLGSRATADAPMRVTSSIDAVDRFGAVQTVPDYPLSVVVTREARIALLPWRAQALGTGVRTVALSALAAVLLVIAMRQLARLHAASASLATSQERYALAVAGSNDGIWDHDLVSGRYFVSARAQELSGIAPGPELVPTDDWMTKLAATVHPEDEPRRIAARTAHLAGETPTYQCELRHRHPDGVYRWVRVQGICLRDAAGRPCRMAGSVSDIDAQKRAEQALRESEERYQLAVNGSNQGLWDWDLVKDTLFLSARAQVLRGIEARGPVTMTRREWIARTTYHPEDVAAVRAAISAHLHGATEHFEVEYRAQHPSGEWRWYRQRGIALRDEQGRPNRMAGSMEDVTEQKNSEGERVKLERQLLQAKKLESIGTLAGGIAHDFNNILAAILGNGEMAQVEAHEGTDLRRHIDAVVSAGTRAKSLVERILAFSRSGIGERVLVHVQSVVDEALHLVGTSLPAHVQLDRQLSAGDARVLGDPTQIHQVVMNLCTNGVQAMKSTGTLTIRLDIADKGEAMVATSTLSSGRYVRLRVSDTGTGIPRNALERIFDPFFTTKGVGVGTGLGLSLVHGIVTDLGGGIEVESRVGEGTTFSVYLPWNSSLAAPTYVEEIVPAGTGETILLVDDEEVLVRLGEEMLARLGYEPVGFSSSVAALEAFRNAPERFCAVLSDQAMPDMAGVELAGEIRAIRNDIPIVLMSGFVSTALSARAAAIGVAEVLVKPLVARDIARSLAAALRHVELPE